MTEVKYNEVKKGLEITARFLQHPNTLLAFIDGFFDEHRLYWEELVSRTSTRFIPRFFLEAIRRIPVGFFGSGTVGGNAALSWFNLGSENILMSEPEKENVETANLLRQAYHRGNLGQHKAAARAENMKNVNPYAKIEVDKRGVTTESIKEQIDKVAVVVDGVEFYRITEIIRLHQEAARQGKPVFVGLDLGFSDIVIFYDYRNNQNAFYGELNDLIPYAEKAQRLFEQGILDEATFKAFVLYFASRMIPVDTIPLEQWNELQDQLLGKTTNVAQLSTTGSNLGNRVAVSIAMMLAGAEVKHISYSNTLDSVVAFSNRSQKDHDIREMQQSILAQINEIGATVMAALDQIPEEE